MESVKEYWNNKFKKKQKIWGEEPSESAVKTLEWLKKIIQHVNLF